MKYSLENLADAEPGFSDFYRTAELELNYVINPRLRLSQAEIDYLIQYVIAARPDQYRRLTQTLPGLPNDGVGCLFDRSVLNEPIIPLPIYEVNEWYRDIRRQWVSGVLAVPPDLKNRFAVEEARRSELEIALFFIKKLGDVRLRDCLSNEEKLALPKNKVSELDVCETIVRLSAHIPDLVISKDVDGALKRPRLTPKGWAVLWHIVDSSRGDHIERQLSRTITDHYGLPDARSYQFLPWKYWTEVGDFPFPPFDLWEERQHGLDNLGLSPINVRSQYKRCGWTDYIKLRNWLIEKHGIDPYEFAAIELDFQSHLGRDFLSKSNAVSDWQAIVLARFFWQDHCLLYDELEQEAGRLLSRVRDAIGRCDPEINPYIFGQAVLELKRALYSDPLMFMVFYSLIFVPKRLLAIRGNSSAKLDERQLKIQPKRGRPFKVGRLAIRYICKPIVDLLRKYNFTFPDKYEMAAKLLNALALTEVYDQSKTGEEIRTGIGSIVDARKVGKSGFVTKGARVLWAQLRGGVDTR